MAGLLAHESLLDRRPSRFPSGACVDTLFAYSCGGSHGLGPYWVIRTVFPINPLDLVRRGTIASQAS